jgi:hypothetical protein
VTLSHKYHRLSSRSHLPVFNLENLIFPTEPIGLLAVFPHVFVHMSMMALIIYQITLPNNYHQSIQIYSTISQRDLFKFVLQTTVRSDLKFTLRNNRDGRSADEFGSPPPYPPDCVVHVRAPVGLRARRNGRHILYMGDGRV